MISGFQPASVTDLLGVIRTKLEDDIGEVFVEGEVSNLSLSGAGHWYFQLSDQESSISCALFKGDALRNPYIQKLKDGDKITIYGPLSVYAKRGTFQIIAKKILPAGEGTLKIQFEKLKQKLSAEGLFDLERKKSLPVFPQRIAIITAENGAALRDFLQIYRRRANSYNILIVPSLVQGENAPKSLINGLRLAQKVSDVDVIVLARGGGSMEDLWAFNDEALVREIGQSKIPIVSAVGHEVDFTLSDYVADFRAETPSSAAEILSTGQFQILNKMSTIKKLLQAHMNSFQREILRKKEQYHPKSLFQRMKLDRIVYEKNLRLDDIQKELSQIMQKSYQDLKIRQERSFSLLNALSPKAVLSRGYSFVATENRKIITSISQFSKYKSGSPLLIHFHDGEGRVIK